MGLKESQSSLSQEYTCKGEFEHHGRFSNFDFKLTMHGGLLNVASRLYSIDKTGQINHLESILTDFRNAELQEVQGYLYFLPFDPIIGRQLFRINQVRY